MAAALPLDDQLCFSLYAASMAVSRVYKPLLDGLGITYPQYLVMHALWENDGLTVGAIAGRLALESSTVTPLLKRLQTAGFLTRARNQADERQVHVSLTARGRKLREECGCLAEAVLAQTGASAEDLAALNRQVRLLCEALNVNKSQSRLGV